MDKDMLFVIKHHNKTIQDLVRRVTELENKLRDLKKCESRHKEKKGADDG